MWDVAKINTTMLMLVISAAAVAGCTTPGPVHTTTPMPVTVGRTSVQVSSGPPPTVQDRPLTETQRLSLTGLEGLSLTAGIPVEITAAGPIPDEGVTLTRSFTSPLPDDAAATLAYFDEPSETWVAVPSVLAADRRSVSAVVQHLSLWDDFITTAGQTGTYLADASFYQIGKVFDTRVDPPTCDAGAPTWVRSTVSIETHVNNPILFCVGSDANNTELLTIKARNNRGFGYQAQVYGNPGWTSNSTWDHSRLEADIKLLTNIDEYAADLVREFTSDSTLVGPGEEFRIGLTESQARQSPDGVVLRLTPQPAGSYILTVLHKQLVSAEIDGSESIVATIMFTARCFKDLTGAIDSGAALKAANTCLLGIADTETATAIGRFFSAERGIDAKAGAKIGGQVVGRLSMYLALIGPAFNALNYAAEGMVDDAAHTVSVFPTTPRPSATSSTDAGSTGHRYTLVPSGQVPDWASADAYCRSDGGYLAHIDSETENDLLYRIMTDQGVESAYFGYTDVAAEGVWVWSDGEPSAYTNWATNEPNAESSLEDQAMFYWKYTDGTWNDGDFTADSTVEDGSAFLCEYGH